MDTRKESCSFLHCRSWLGAAKLAVVTTLACATFQAQAQAHEKREGGYVLRSSVVASQTFDADTARAHGIEPAPRRAVLNVTLQRMDGRLWRNVRGDVQARATDLTGRRQAIELRPVVGNGMVSYLGVFDFAPRQVLDFRIVAQPRGRGAPITLTFRERIWVPGRSPR